MEDEEILQLFMRKLLNVLFLLQVVYLSQRDPHSYIKWTVNTQGV